MSDTTLSREELRALVLAEMRRVDSSHVAASKDVYRELHAPAVQFQLEKHQNWVRRKLPRYSHFFANGKDVNPGTIKPVLTEVTETWQEDLWRLARLTWSLPYSRGYGRRLRFLIMDSANNKLIGILGLQSPPLDFPVRDRLFNYPPGRKTEFVNQTMDIHTLGTVQPYSRLLGGKLVAYAAVSDEVRAAYRRKYEGRHTEMGERILPPELVALTTTSAFGRSSIYQRLKYKARPIAESIGFTEGYGSFHLARLYPLLQDFLRTEGIEPKTGFGSGPRIVWQTCVIAFRLLGLPRDSLRHGLKREAFLFPLVSNLSDYVEGRAEQPVSFHLSFTELSDWWRERWLLPRSERVDGWHAWDSNSIRKLILIGSQGDE